MTYGAVELNVKGGNGEICYKMFFFGKLLRLTGALDDVLNVLSI